MSAPIPRVGAKLLDGAGGIAREWYAFFSALSSSASSESVQAAIADILARLAELEGGSSVNFQMLGLQSVRIEGAPSIGYVRLMLDGDQTTPGMSYYYGTDASGTKGWFSIPVTSVNGQTGEVELGVADLVDVDLTTVPPEDGNALVWDETAGKWVPGEGGGGIEDVIAGTGISIDKADPKNPIVSTALAYTGAAKLLRVGFAANTTIAAAAAGAKVPYDSVFADDGAIWDAGNLRAVVPTSGKYYIAHHMSFQGASSSVSGQALIAVTSGSTKGTYLGNVQGPVGRFSASQVLALQAGDIIEAHGARGSSATLLGSDLACSLTVLGPLNPPMASEIAVAAIPELPSITDVQAALANLAARLAALE